MSTKEMDRISGTMFIMMSETGDTMRRTFLEDESFPIQSRQTRELLPS